MIFCVSPKNCSFFVISNRISMFFDLQANKYFWGKGLVGHGHKFRREIFILFWASELISGLKFYCLLYFYSFFPVCTVMDFDYVLTIMRGEYCSSISFRSNFPRFKELILFLGRSCLSSKTRNRYFLLTTVNCMTIAICKCQFSDI